MIFDSLRSMARRTAPHDPADNPNRMMLTSLPTAGIHISHNTAMCIASVWECVRIISETLAMLPWRVFESVEEGGRPRRRVLPNSQLDFLLHKRPNDEMPALFFKEAIQAHAALWGNGYAEIEFPSGSGDPSALHLITPDRVEQKRNAAGQLFYQVSDDAGGTTDILPDRMLHIRGPSWGGHVGYDLIKMARETFSTAVATEQFTAAFFGNGAQLGGIITAESSSKGLSEDGITNLLASFNKKHRGSRKAHKTGYLDAGLTYQEIGVNPEQAQLLEAKRFNVLDVARWFRMPPHKLAQLDQSIKANIESQGIEFVTDTMLPWVLRWEQEGDFKLFPKAERGRRFTKMDLNMLLRGDSSARGTFYKTMTAIGAFNINEVREFEDKDSIGQAGDLRLVPMNMVSIEEANRSGQTGITRTRGTDAHISVFEDATERLVRNECYAIGRLANKSAPLDEFKDMLVEFYSRHSGRMAELLSAPARALVMYSNADAGEPEQDQGAAIAASCARAYCDISCERFVTAYERDEIHVEVESTMANAAALAQDIVSRITVFISTWTADEQTIL